MRTLVLASASPARLRLLRDAGLDPVVRVSGVDESVVPLDDVGAAVQALAVLKAEDVAARCTGGELVLGCDSLLDLDGRALGKPADAAQALARWQDLRGRSGRLLTGHCLLDTAAGTRAAEVAATTVRFGHPTDRELQAYVASGEPLRVAGGFTLDGRSAPFLGGIDGDAGNVLGLSLPLLRDLLGRLGVEVVDLWAP